MAINGSTINGAAINSLIGEVYSVSISESTQLQGYDTPLGPYYPVSSSIEYTTDLTYTQTFTISEVVSLVLTELQTINSSLTITEIITIIDDILVSYNSTISESIVYTSTLTGLIYQLELLIESVSLSDSVSDKVIFINTISNILSIIDSIDYGTQETIVDLLVLDATLVDLYKSYATLIESVINTDTLSPSHISIISLSDEWSLLGTSTSKSQIYNVIIDDFILSVPTTSGQNAYLGYALSPETNSITTYTNYNFDGSCEYEGNYYFYNSTGLYKYGGTTDNNVAIRSIIETAGMSFGTTNKKSIPSIYLGATNSGGLILKVRVDGIGEIFYKLNKYTNHLQTQKIDVGKGLLARYFQFELIVDATSFDMESIDFMPMEVKRKL